MALATASGERAAAVVELQVGPRGPGSVSASPAGVDLDNGNVAVTEPCDRSDGGDSCRFGYEQGTTVTLNARADSGRTFVGWSDPDCPGTGSCTLTLDAAATSIVALFSPLKLAVRYSGDGEGGTVTIDRQANTCTEGGADACFELAPRSEVRLTARPAAGHTFQGWSPGCEPTNAPTCTIGVNDQPTWAGAIFDDDEALQLPTTIKVQFRLEKTGDGGGQVTASKLECGDECTAQFDYGQTVTLTAAPDSGSVFGGWNGVCAQTETTCSFPVGPITSVKAQFARAPFAARVVGVSVAYGGSRTVVVRLSVNEATTATLRLLRSGRAIATVRPRVDPGTTSVRLRVPKRAVAGAYRIAIAVAKPDGGTLTLPGRNVFVRRAR
ncbi:MAG: hypothetical protein H0V94_07645 [Actinobacteria bacterium]|nr:hypothetical protein [Actinomycetota bacterium]